MKLFEYQNNAVEEVLSKMQSNTREIRFQAPTGSGKTFMTAHIVKGINQSAWGLKHPKRTYLYIAPSTGQLDYQGYKKISSYIDNGFMSGYKTQYIDQTLSMDFLPTNTINFIGWGMIKKGSSILREYSEGKTLYDIIEETHNRGIEIILLVDEAHREYKVKKTSVDYGVRKTFIDALDYIKSIEMSATLDGKVDVKVFSSDVKQSGVIKQSVIINSDTDLYEADVIKSLIQSGINKINEIKKSISKTDMPELNPLLLIQIPDGKPEIDGKDINKFYQNIIEEMFEKNDYKEGYDYAIWLDKNKTTKNKEEITKNNSHYKVIVFKQALATGWDVPRAHVLVKLRNPTKGSKSFEIQTIGRILRNPFLKIFKTYKPLTKDDVHNLNNAFVYTNDEGWASQGIENDYEGILMPEYGKFELSERAIKNPIKLNNISAKIRVNNTEALFENVIADNAHNDFFESLSNSIKNTKIYSGVIGTQELDGASISDNKINVINSSNELGYAKGSLFYIYVSFINVISNNKNILKLVNAFSTHYKINKKAAYIYLTNNYKKSIAVKNNPVLINTELIKIISKEFADNTKFEVDSEFGLQHIIKYSKKGISSHPDGLGNSYKVYMDSTKNISESSFDSSIEIDFYNEITEDISKYENIHIFRNKTNPNDSYFSQYYNSFENRVSSFYPDFILATEENIFVIECKGLGKNDIDNNTSSKIESLYRNIDKIKSDKNVHIVKVGRQNIKDTLSYEIFTTEGYVKTVFKAEFWKMVANQDVAIEKYCDDKNA